jgi:hypothetical protein
VTAAEVEACEQARAALKRRQLAARNEPREERARLHAHARAVRLELAHEASRCMQCGRRTQLVDFAVCDDCDDSDIPWGDDTDRECIAGWDGETPYERAQRERAVRLFPLDDDGVDPWDPGAPSFGGDP